MVRTQIRLPEALHRELKRLAAAREWTLAETLRRAAEHWLQIHSPDRIQAAGWEPPAPLSLGAFRCDDENWRELANLAPVVREKRKR
jgi:predicted transcriptional regulator